MNVCGSINDWRMDHNCAAQTVPHNINACIYKNDIKKDVFDRGGVGVSNSFTTALYVVLLSQLWHYPQLVQIKHTYFFNTPRPFI